MVAREGPLDDYATLIRDTALKGVKEGALGITVRDGLAAQKLLDTRAAKGDDRKVAMAIAALLAGGSGGFLAPQRLIVAGADVIEGAFEDITESDID